jgi:hypothetical protein
MFPSYSHYELVASDRRQRYQAEARRHRLLGSLRRRHTAGGGVTSPVALPSISPGRTPGGIDRKAA